MKIFGKSVYRLKSNWRKKISILAETGIGSDNGKINRKSEEDLKKKIYDKCQRSNTVDMNIQAENASKSSQKQKI